MFWNKKKSDEIGREPIFAPKPLSKSVIATIEEIHSEFDTAADNALAEARRILDKEMKHDPKRTEMLKRLGFNGCSEIVLSEAEKGARQLQENRASIVEKYRIAYPNNKFIFLDQVTKICGKYGLVCGDVAIYKGTVPTKNLEEIDAFRAKREDEHYIQYYTGGSSVSGRRLGDVFTVSGASIVNGDRVDEEERRYREAIRPIGLPDPHYAHYFGSRDFEYHKVPLYICAPKADMNTEGKTMKGVFAVTVPDPIVLHYVKDGFLILSKWGLEGQDSDLVNETHN